MGSVVLLSGGIDSTTCAAIEAASGRLDACIFIDYGQPARKQEQAAAETWCAGHGVRLFAAALPLEIGAMGAPAGEVGPRIVPGRNLALAALAVSVAISIDSKAVVLGATGGDSDTYPDCRLPFIRALSSLCRKTYGVQLEAPLAHRSKRAVVAIARAEGVDLSATWSCYTPDDSGAPCRTCNACKERSAVLPALVEGLG
jgi:7-cyano-7-deazaguanine synthase